MNTLKIKDITQEAADRYIEQHRALLAPLQAYIANKLDLPTVIHRVAKLFHEHNNLVMGFNEFLPPNLKIHISDSSIVGSTAQRSNVTVHMAVAAPVATVGAGHQAPRAIRHYQLNIDELIGGLQSACSSSEGRCCVICGAQQLGVYSGSSSNSSSVAVLAAAVVA
eukprot:17053-Heterococcus_DN1.PRE.1